MITLSKVTKAYSGTKVVGDISLTIKPGEIVGLLGPNGAGKTTTIKMIGGILPPTSGKITINNKEFLGHEPELKKEIGYLPENNPLYDELTVEEHLLFWSQMKGLVGDKREAAIKFAVNKTGISEVYYRMINELSKGYRQRVGLAQAILGKPNILLLDEPTEGLDPNQRKDIQHLLAELGNERTVIVSSHVLGEISKLASRIVIIHRGKIVGDDSLNHLLATHTGKQVVMLEITGTGVIKGLKEIKAVETVEEQEKNHYLVTTKTDRDIRKDIFNMAVTKKWTLLGMQKMERQLEDVFSELTEE